MRTILLLISFIGISYFTTLALAQNRIEIFVNGNIQKITTEAINVSYPKDKIEIRIYDDQIKKKIYLIDSIKSEGCGNRVVVKNKTIFKPSKNHQQVQQSSTKSRYKEFDAIVYRKPIVKGGYYLFEFTVEELTGCLGKYFYISMIFDTRKSKLKSYKNFYNKYKFIYA